MSAVAKATRPNIKIDRISVDFLSGILSKLSPARILADMNVNIKNLEGIIKREKGGNENTGWSGAALPRDRSIPSRPKEIKKTIKFLPFSFLGLITINRHKVRIRTS